MSNVNAADESSSARVEGSAADVLIQSRLGLTGSLGKKCRRMYSGLPSSSSSSMLCFVGGTCGLGSTLVRRLIVPTFGIDALALPLASNILITPSDSPMLSLISLCSSIISLSDIPANTPSFSLETELNSPSVPPSSRSTSIIAWSDSRVATVG